MTTTGMLLKKWKNYKEYVEQLDYAFQPIVNIHTGVCYGVEALMRKQEDIGFPNIYDLFDRAFKEGCLFWLDLLLREKVIKKFSAINFHRKIKLFYNLDNRLLRMPDYAPGSTSEMQVQYGLERDSLCLEISERHELFFGQETHKAFNDYKSQTLKIAIDDFGTGFSGLQLLYHSDPDFIKIDRFFITEIGNDPKKKLFVSNIIKMAHILGIQVIAEGIETETEFYVCHDIGCDLIQGYLIQRPTQALRDIEYRYESVAALNQKNRRKTHSDEDLIHDRIKYVEPVCHPEHSVLNLLEIFQGKDITYLPVVNSNQEPLGIVREGDLKEYIYKPFGIELLKNKSMGFTLLSFLSKIPVAEITTEIDQILDIVMADKGCEAILLTENGKYIGLLSMQALLNLLHEKNIAVARDQNPLTKLPGNTIINEHIAGHLSNGQSKKLFVYFDFDYFKPFNDTYGFRRGDRAILLFADILKEFSHRHQMFIGHIGGDDFFASINIVNGHDRDYIEMVQEIVDKFRKDAENLYDAEDIKNGYVLITNREGGRVQVPLLSVSAAVLVMGEGMEDLSLENIAQGLASIKGIAKKVPNKVAVHYMGKTGELLRLVNSV
jgi:diguanylate cyclase (GGDEF)-like protein